MYDVCFKDGKHFSETDIPIIGSKNPWKSPSSTDIFLLSFDRKISGVTRTMTFISFRYFSPSRLRFRKFELAKILKKMPSNQLLRSLTKLQTLALRDNLKRFCPKDSALRILTPQKSRHFENPKNTPASYRFIHPSIGGSNRGFLGWDMLTPKKSTSSPAAGTRTPLM